MSNEPIEELPEKTEKKKKVKKVIAVAVIVIAVLYGVSPIDILPDIIPVIGLADDAILAVFALVNGVRAFKK
jgi:uncharacterized membrane protein YkvA (DUF1232 family)